MATEGPDTLRTEGQTLSLMILSPSTEFNTGLSFQALPVTTTVDELKRKIRDAVPTRPTLERQRLIYRGRLLSSGSATMKDVFGEEALDDPAEKRLHLVLTPVHPGVSYRNDGLPNLPPASAPASPFSESRTLAPELLEGDTRPVVNQNPIRHQPNHRAYNNLPLPPSAFPPEVQAHLMIHNAAVAHAMGQHGAPGSDPPPSFEHLVAQQQQQRASGGLPGLSGSLPAGGNNTVNGGNETSSNQETTTGFFPTDPPISTSVQSSITQEMQGPNGETVRITTIQGNIRGGPSSGDNSENNSPGRNPTDTNDPQRVSTVSQQLPSITTQQQSLANIWQPSPMAWLLSGPAGPYAILQTPVGTYTSQFGHFRSPNGPASSATNPQPRNRHPSHRALNQQHQEQQQQIQNIEALIAQYQQQAHVNAAREAPAQENALNNNQRRVQANNDLARQLVPLAGHLWLLVRLVGFVWFFAAGASWRRIIILGSLALLVFLKQTGLLDGIQHAIWDPVRHHLEGLVPLDHNRQHPNNAQMPQPARQDGQGGEPDPRRTAERLIREREERERGWIRRRFRGMERAIAIFVASLIPGVGERHIAAREAADAVRQVEERIRVENEERERGQGQGQQGGEQAQEGGDQGAGGEREGGDGNGGAGVEREGEAQREPPPPMPFI